MAAATQGRVMKEVIKSYSYVLLWMSISISVILFNKWLLAFSGFPYPITLTMWHMLFCSNGRLPVRAGGEICEASQHECARLPPACDADW